MSNTVLIYSNHSESLRSATDQAGLRFTLARDLDDAARRSHEAVALVLELRGDTHMDCLGRADFATECPSFLHIDAQGLEQFLSVLRASPGSPLWQTLVGARTEPMRGLATTVQLWRQRTGVESYEGPPLHPLALRRRLICDWPYRLSHGSKTTEGLGHRVLHASAPSFKRDDARLLAPEDFPLDGPPPHVTLRRPRPAR